MRTEFRSPTQKAFAKISDEAVKHRLKGIKHVQQEIAKNIGDKEVVQNLISSLNMNLSQAQKEAKTRGIK